MKRICKIGLIVLLLLGSGTAMSQEPQFQNQTPPVTRIIFVFDFSQSMFGLWQSDQKINIARKLLSKVLDSLKTKNNVELALRAYGHLKEYPPQDCDDTRLEVPFGKNNHEQIKSRLRNIEPRGTTPIAYALQKAGDDFPPCDNCRNVVVLITDGIEECGGDPCAVSQELQRKGIILKPFIIGIGRNFEIEFDCVGTYFDASSESEFSNALDYVISQALNPTSAQVNLLDKFGNPTETNVNMTFYDHVSGKVKHNFIHTINRKGVPDTLIIDPLVTYDIVVHTIPPVVKDSVTIVSGKHTVIPIETPQGYLRLKIDGYDASMRGLQCIVRRNDEHETINVQNFGHTEKYLTGLYDLEVLCLPRIYIDDVEILQSSTTTVEIPVPGIAVLTKSTLGYGSVYLEKGDSLEWVYNFRENNPNQETLILQPGTYRVIFRAKYIDKTIFGVEQQFRVNSGRTTNVKIYK